MGKNQLKIGCIEGSLVKVINIQVFFYLHKSCQLEKNLGLEKHFKTKRKIFFERKF